MYPYMEERDTPPSPALYYNLEHAQKAIIQKDPLQIARDAHVGFDAERSCFSFLSLNQSITVSYPECGVVFTETGTSPVIHWQMPILHYLAIADGTPLSGELASIRDLKKHVAHPELFERETGGALYENFGSRSLSSLKEACIALGGVINKSNADLFTTLAFLPSFPIHIKLWMADDEMHGSGKMLFDKHSLHYLDEMDIHVVGPLIVKFLTMHYSLIERN